MLARAHSPDGAVRLLAKAMDDEQSRTRCWSVLPAPVAATAWYVTPTGGLRRPSAKAQVIDGGSVGLLLLGSATARTGAEDEARGAVPHRQCLDAREYAYTVEQHPLPA